MTTNCGARLAQRRLKAKITMLAALIALICVPVPFLSFILFYFILFFYFLSGMEQVLGSNKNNTKRKKKAARKRNFFFSAI